MSLCFLYLFYLGFLTWSLGGPSWKVNKLIFFILHSSLSCGFLPFFPWSGQGCSIRDYSYTVICSYSNLDTVLFLLAIFHWPNSPPMQKDYFSVMATSWLGHNCDLSSSAGIRYTYRTRPSPSVLKVADSVGTETVRSPANEQLLSQNTHKRGKRGWYSFCLKYTTT